MHPSTRRRRLLLVVTAVLALLLPLGLTSSQSALAGLLEADQALNDLSDGAQTDTPADDAPPADNAGWATGNADPTATVGTVTSTVPAPAIAWSPCTNSGSPGPAYDCATYALPLDYRRPNSGTVSLALQRRRATIPADKIGTLFMNPGGPGTAMNGMVTAAVRFLGTEVTDRFDVVTFDPRGVGGSTAVQCFASDEAFLATYGSKVVAVPVTSTEISGNLSASKAYARACRNDGGSLLAHMSTLNVARDLDVLRRAVGDTQLSYVGFSYGTLIGATYANIYPGKVRTIALDGNVDFAGRTNARLINKYERAGGFENALDAWFDACDDAGSTCAFSGGNSTGTGNGTGTSAKFDALRQRLRSGPVVLGGGTQVTLSSLTTVVAQYLYRIPLYATLGSLLQNVYAAAFPPGAAPAAAVEPGAVILPATVEQAEPTTEPDPGTSADPTTPSTEEPAPAEDPTTNPSAKPTQGTTSGGDQSSGGSQSGGDQSAGADAPSDPADADSGPSAASVPTTTSELADPATVFSSDLPSLPLVDGVDPTPQTVDLIAPSVDSYSYSSTDAFFAVNCVDAPLPRWPSAYPKFADWFERKQTTFGRQEAFSELVCASWPVPPVERYAGPWNRRTASPLLLVNGVHDPATPYLFAKRSVRELRNARLLTLEGYGHTSSGTSSCVIAAYARYFIDRQLPAAGARCEQDVSPFPR